MDIDPADDLFVQKPPGAPADGEGDEDNADDDVEVEEIYHLTHRHFYPNFNCGLLERSMGVTPQEPLAPPHSTSPELIWFEVDFLKHHSTDAGSLRNYIILGTRPTFPHTVVTFLRHIIKNPLEGDTGWHYPAPQPPYSTAPGSVVHWIVDIPNMKLTPCPLSGPPRRAVRSTNVIGDLVMLSANSAWDIQRDEFAQAIAWSNIATEENSVFEVRYGEQGGSFELKKLVEATACLCGCGMAKKEDVHIKISLKSGMIFWFPYQVKEIPPGAGEFKYIANEFSGQSPFIYIDLADLTRAELARHFPNATLDVRALEVAILTRKPPLRFCDSKDHADWYASAEALFICIEWATRTIFRAKYRINPLDLTVKSLGIVSKRHMPEVPPHDCEAMSAELPIKHYPKWGYKSSSMFSLKLEEIGVELQLDGISDTDDDLLVDDDDDE
ncbi:hypothetical protein TWF696_009802 [Orbilia brochopaga]|uniref:Uncharacterized protein n=1 Tax=Orbilia brochopaga TaxID=3140254 RepID=A0AAV9UFD8_9PEZI